MRRRLTKSCVTQKERKKTLKTLNGSVIEKREKKIQNKYPVTHKSNRLLF